MTDLDIDPFGEHESRTDESTDEHISLSPVGGGRSTWNQTEESKKHHSDKNLKEPN